MARLPAALSVPAGRRKQARTFISLAAPRAAAVLVSIPTAVIIAREYGPDGRGVIAAVVATSLLVAGLANLSVGDSVAVLVAQGVGPRKPRRFILGLWSAGVLVSAAAIALFKAEAATWFVAALSLLWVLNIMCGVAVLGMRGPAAWAWSNLAQPALFFVFLLYVTASNKDVQWVLHGYAASVALVTIVLLLLVPVQREGADLTKSFMPVIRYALLRHVGNTGQTLLLKVDIVFLAAFRDVREVGLYAVAYGTAQLVFLVPVTLGGIIFHRELSAGGSRSRSPVRLTLLITALPGAALAAVAPLLIPLVYGRQFGAAVVPLVILIPGVVGYGLGLVLANQLAASGHAKEVAASTLLVAAPTTAITFAAVAAWGMYGAAVASSLSYILMGYMMLRLRHRFFGVTQFDDKVAA